MPMADAPGSDTPAEDAKVREEWRRLEQRRIEEEIAEARDDAVGAGPVRRGPHWFVWVALALAFAAGVAVTVFINGIQETKP